MFNFVVLPILMKRVAQSYQCLTNCFQSFYGPGFCSDAVGGNAHLLGGCIDFQSSFNDKIPDLFQQSDILRSVKPGAAVIAFDL